MENLAKITLSWSQNWWITSTHKCWLNHYYHGMHGIVVKLWRGWWWCGQVARWGTCVVWAPSRTPAPAGREWTLDTSHQSYFTTTVNTHTDTVAWVHDEMHGTRWHELNRGGALTIAGCDHDDVWLQQRTYAEEEDWYSSFWGSGYTWSIKGFKLKLYILHALHTCIMKIE